MLMFQDEIEGSILYQELLDSAWKFYSENLVKKKRYEFINRRLKQIIISSNIIQSTLDSLKSLSNANF